MPGFFKAHWKKLLFFVPVLAGALVIGQAIEGRQTPRRSAPGEVAKNVRVIIAPKVTLAPRAVGYGNVRPGRVWRAVAQVGGQIVTINRRLKKGGIIAKGEVLLRIDPTGYRLAITRAMANIRVVKAQLEELAARRQNTRDSLKIENQSLALAKKELQRKRQLFGRGTASQAAVDQEQRNVLKGRQGLQSLRNGLNLMPAEGDVLAAQLAQNQAQLASAKLNLRYTTIRAPFNGRVAKVDVERTQFAAQGQELAVIDATDVFEITAQVPLGRLLNLAPQSGNLANNPANGAADSAAPVLPLERATKFLELKAIVRLRGGSVKAQWPARVSRFSDAIDPNTRTVGVIVTVDNPYRGATPGEPPALSKNMFVEVELRGRPRPGQIVIPRSSLHGNNIYVIDQADRLRIRPVEVAFSQADFMVIKKGLAAGEMVVVSDPIPAIDGMLVKPHKDDRAAARLIASAEGAGTVR